MANEKVISPENSTPPIRLAFVQIDYQPSAVLAYPHIEEPALLSEGELGITSLYIPVRSIANRVNAFRKRVANAYEENIRRQLSIILEKLNALQTDVVVFPEYAIPASCLGIIDTESVGMSIIAASHTVTSQTLDYYREVGINVGESDIGKSICPIKFHDGSWKHIEKLTRSKWELQMRPGTRWEALRLTTRSGHEFVAAVLLCVDFINENDANLQQYVPREIWTIADIGIVPSYSPIVTDFENRAKPVASRAGKPIIYVNVASVGGSRAFCHFDEVDPFAEHEGTKPLAAGDEAIVVLDIFLGNKQFSTKPSRLPVQTCSNVHVVLPVLAHSAFVPFSSLLQKVRLCQSDANKRDAIQAAADRLKELLLKSGTPSILQKKVFSLLEAMSWRDGVWLERCLDHIVLPEQVTSVADKRYELIYSAQQLLASMIGETSVRGESLETISDVINVYRRNLDAMRPRVSSEVLQKFDPSTSSIHTVSDDAASPEQFTSFFLLRLKSARVHRDALQKQVRMLTTIAFEGNAHLGLNVRYVSRPNPGGNLKDLEIQIIGTARSRHQPDSRKLADTFRRDLETLLRVTLRDVYLFEHLDLDSADLPRATEPFPFNHIIELHRKVSFGVQPYLDNATSPNICHLEGSSTFARILDLLQSNPAKCMISVHLHPVSMTGAEEAFFTTCQRMSISRPEATEGTMFFLGSEVHPALRFGDAQVMQRMLHHTDGKRPILMVRLTVASDEPISQLLLNTIGDEIWGSSDYCIAAHSENETNHEIMANALRIAWIDEQPIIAGTPVNLERFPFLFDPYEACRMFRLPLEGHSGAVGTLFSVLPAPAAALPDEGVQIGLGFHSGAQKPLVVRLADTERTKHSYIIGKTGTGKSTLLCNMIEQDIARGSGVCVIDPHGELVNAVLCKIPQNRADDVVMLDPSATDRPFGLNMLEFNEHIAHHRDFVVQETISIMRKLFYFEHGGPIFEHNLRHLVLTIMDSSLNGCGTLIEVPRLLYDTKFRKAIIPNLSDELAQDFWQQYDQMSDFHKSEKLSYIVSKFDTFTTDHESIPFLVEFRERFPDGLALMPPRPPGSQPAPILAVARGVIGTDSDSLSPCAVWVRGPRAHKPANAASDWSYASGRPVACVAPPGR